MRGGCAARPRPALDRTLDAIDAVDKIGCRRLIRRDLVAPDFVDCVDSVDCVDRPLAGEARPRFRPDDNRTTRRRADEETRSRLQALRGREARLLVVPSSCHLVVLQIRHTLSGPLLEGAVALRATGGVSAEKGGKYGENLLVLPVWYV